MVNYCCVPQCNTKAIRGNGIKFHIFPKNKQMVSRWLRAIKSGKKPTKYTKICSLHFKEADYKDTIYSGYTKRFLKENVIPSENLPKTSHGTYKRVDSARTSDIKYVEENDFSQNTDCVQAEVNQILQVPEVCNVNGDAKRFLKPFAIPNRNLPKDSCHGNLLKHVKLRQNQRPLILGTETSVKNERTVHLRKLYEVSAVKTGKDRSLQNFEKNEESGYIFDKSVELDKNYITSSHKITKLNKVGTIVCFVPDCNNKSSKQCGLKFHSFPSDPILARLWNVKLQSGKIPTKSSRICSKHFRLDDYIKSSTGDKQLKYDAVPSRCIPKKPIKHLMLLPEPNNQDVLPAFQPIRIPKQETHHATTQTDKQNVSERAMQTDDEPIPTETMNYDELSADDYLFFTGLKLPSFIELTEYLDIDNQSNKYTKTMSNYDQLTLTLIKLRHKFEFKILAKMYGIHRDIVHDIFVMWINVMFDRFKKTDLWAIRDKGDHSGYTAILNCCEIPCLSNNSDFHTVLKSDTKKRLTIKYLVATDEQGMVIFCSNQLFGGSITNRQVIIQSGILNKLRNGDKILTDCDFGINDLLKTNGIIFHQLHECSDINKGREYIKRVAIITKKFGILKGVFPAILMQYAAKIVYVINVLVNFVTEVAD